MSTSPHPKVSISSTRRPSPYVHLLNPAAEYTTFSTFTSRPSQPPPAKSEEERGRSSISLPDEGLTPILSTLEPVRVLAVIDGHNSADGGRYGLWIWLSVVKKDMVCEKGRPTVGLLGEEKKSTFLALCVWLASTVARRRKCKMTGSVEQESVGATGVVVMEYERVCV
ncbi:hypothetical protein POTOM_043136 [Populus tomentosa]|uniref:Uncharacterized protein n=1 Tax=Populus tomentosa TaxID=118781 RepID=A0A8X7YQ14_POPTO|nr:hypothetical protein POTOM_043136 [Populus tomentosa]